jgi:hypothetical protein
VKAMVYARKVKKREELLWRILNVARRKSNASMLRKVKNSLVTRVGKCIQADAGHFEQLT